MVVIYLYFPFGPSWQLISSLYLTLVVSFYGVSHEALLVTFISSVLAMGLILPYSPGRTPSEEITRISVFLYSYSCIFLVLLRQFCVLRFSEDLPPFISVFYFRLVVNILVEVLYLNRFSRRTLKTLFETSANSDCDFFVRCTVSQISRGLAYL